MQQQQSGKVLPPNQGMIMHHPVSPRQQSSAPTVPSVLLTVVRWFDSWAGIEDLPHPPPQQIDWLRVLPFLAMHLLCCLVLWVGWSWTAVVTAGVLYGVRMFAITGFYHRYFSHRAFKTSRWCQFAFAVLGASAVQRGPLWWAAHHRHHHAHSDQITDMHSPHHHGFWWSHVGWFMTRAAFVTNVRAVPDLAKFPELCFLDRFDILVAIFLAVFLYALGVGLETFAPTLQTNGWQLLVWGFFLSTVVLYHCTYTVNSFAHQLGRQRYATNDQSRNSFLLAVVTFGEGWHNNHHHYPAAARQGFYWWEIDLTYYALILFSWLGVIWDLKPVPPRVRNTKRLDLAQTA